MITRLNLVSITIKLMRAIPFQHWEGDARGWWAVYTISGTDFSNQPADTEYIEQRIRFVNSEVKSPAIYLQLSTFSYLPSAIYLHDTWLTIWY
jgi:hypothetical protein